MKLLIRLLYFYLFVFIFGQLSKVSLDVPQINLYLSDIIVGLLIGTWLTLKIVMREKFEIPPLAKPILIFSLIAFISLLINSFLKLEGRELFIAWLYLFRWIVYSGIYFLIFDLLKKNVISENRIKDLLIISGLSFSVFGLFQYFLIPDTRFLEIFGWDPHYYRLIGTFFDPGFTGAILALSLILIADKLLSLKNIFIEKAYLLSGLIIYIALALTYSRASYLLYLAGIFVLSIFRKKYLFLIAVIFIGFITILILPRPGGEGVRLERESTIIFRIINWQQSIAIAKDHLLFGVGFNAYRYTQRDFGFLPFANWEANHAGGGADSSLLFTLATTGIFGLLTFLWIWVKAILLSIKQQKIVVIAVIFGLLVHSFFVNSLFYPWIMAWFWVIFAFVKDEKNN